ncbi:unnamed protein product [Ilex paraguariensis]|uniref:Membrane-associated kinase regulator 2 n=1 Tax=Ilex paraguariensis TaxID=185542 RepID=A0ABC8UVH7_9AQUA
MEAFSLLDIWRNAGDNATVGGKPKESVNNSSTTAAANDGVRCQVLETDDKDEESFFDLVFTAPDCDVKEQDNDKNMDINVFDNLSFKKDGETRLDLVDSPNDFFCKRKILPIEPASKPQSPIYLLKSPPKFRVFMLGFKKSKVEKTEVDRGVSTGTPQQHQRQRASQQEQSRQSKRFTVKCKLEEIPIASLFTRDNSLRSKLRKEFSDESLMDDSSKGLPKDGFQKYLKLIKPLYVRASKRYSDNMRFSDQFSTVTPLSSPGTSSMCSPRKETEEKKVSFPAGLRVVCKRLAKSRSASSAVGIVPSTASRRDDSLLQQHDGIQSAILHCKRSYNSSSKESSVLAKSLSDHCDKESKSKNLARNSDEEAKRCSI